MNNSTMSAYLKDISKYPLLSAEEEQNLANLMVDGDAEARDRLIKSNLRLVIKIVRDMRIYRVPTLDAIEDGNLGLIHAAELFRPGNTKFSTYASYWIRQAIRQGIRKGGYAIHVPNYMFSVASQVMSDNNEHFDVEKAEQFFEHRRNKKKAIDHARKAVDVIQGPMNSVDPCERQAVQPTDEMEDLFQRDELEFVLSKMDSLDPREKEVIRLRYGIGDQPPMTLFKIGEMLGITKERVRQIETQGMQKLREIASEML